MGWAPVAAGGPSGGADLPVRVSVGAGHRRPVTPLRGGCCISRVRLGRRGRDVRLAAVADNNRHRASGSREHRDVGQLAPAWPPWLRRLEPPRGRGQQGRESGCDAVLQNLARLLNPRRRPGARSVHPAYRGCSGALGKWLDLSGRRLHLSRHPARPALPQARRAAQLPAAPRREPPGGPHLHFHGLDAAQVAAITARRQEGRRCEPGRLAARQAHMPTRAAQALPGRMRRPWRWWLRGAGYVLLVAAISYGLLWLVLV